MSGDTSPIRDLGYLAWQNDLLWMESQEGPKWVYKSTIDTVKNVGKSRWDLN